jgi:hypothetical protein
MPQRLETAVEVRGLDPLVVNVQEPQFAGVPARALGELQAARIIDQ